MFDLRAQLFPYRLFGLTVTIAPAGLLSFLLLAVLCVYLSARLVHLSLGLALVAGLLSAVIFYLSELAHQFGHAWAARRTGYPMAGIHFFLILAASLYPPDEPPLPPAVHVRRALGGFWINLLLGLLCLPVALPLWPRGAEILPAFPSFIAWLAVFGFVTNFIILGVGSLLPLRLPGGGVTDGATLLRYLGQ
jgi:hypothetical protein